MKNLDYDTFQIKQETKLVFDLISWCLLLSYTWIKILYNKLDLCHPNIPHKKDVIYDVIAWFHNEGAGQTLISVYATYNWILRTTMKPLSDVGAAE